MNLEAIERLIDDAAAEVEAIAARLHAGGEPGPDVELLDRLADQIAASRSDAEDIPAPVTAEGLVVEASSLLVAAAADEPDGRIDRALGCLDDAVALVEQLWPAVRMSVLMRAMALAAPLSRPSSPADPDAVTERLERWAQLAAAARARQSELRTDGVADLALAQHLVDRLDGLTADQQPRIRAYAHERAEAAQLALAFAGDRQLTRRARELARTTAAPTVTAEPPPPPAVEPAPPPPAAPAEPAPFAPTHQLPTAGSWMWDIPDPNRNPVSHADGGLPVRLLEQQGAWGRVVFSNGWEAWMDARELVPLA